MSILGGSSMCFRVPHLCSKIPKINSIVLKTEGAWAAVAQQRTLVARMPMDWRIRHSHLASTLFHSFVPWCRSRRIRPQITRLSQLETENSAMGTWPIYKKSIIPNWFEKWRDTSNGSWCMGIKGEMSGTVCVTFTWDMYIYMSCL